MALVLAACALCVGCRQADERAAEPAASNKAVAPELPGARESATEGPAAALAGDPSLPGLEGDPAVDARLRGLLAEKGPDHRPRTHHLKPDGGPKYVNRLIGEVSPYLLQHAHNPVDWYPWGDAAFARARALDRPVLLSVGYSTCHWCHVMERESFEDEEIARFINTHFVAIKVDREERPDVDGLYMDAVHLLAGRGGWPMTVVMTADRRPFFAGTYFPARDGDRGARKGFFTILRELSTHYADDREALVQRAGQVTARLQAAARPRPPDAVPGPEAIVEGVRRFAQRFDATWGGFGPAPKFPRPVVLELLLRDHRRTGDAQAQTMALHTLRKMARGGLYDHLGGGFHRYAVDRRWRVPHFEKMLYDNAQLAAIYVDAWQVSGDAELAAVARETLDYVLREMTAPEGGFYSATDADSLGPDGHAEEGRFFTWTPAEVEAVVGAAGLATLRRIYPISARGDLDGRAILHMPRSLAEAATRAGMAPDGLAAAVAPLERALLAHRGTRPAPLRDDKIITAWNGQMLGALARAGRVLGEARYTAAARAAAAFLLERVVGQGGRLQRLWAGGRARGAAFLVDYADVIAGLIELYEATGEARWLKAALELQRLQDAHFADAVGGGYFRTAADGEALLARQKPHYDGARPSGNAVAARNLLRLHAFTGDARLQARADRLLGAFAARMIRTPTAVPAMLSALELRHDTPLQVVLVADDRADAEPLRRAVRARWLPNRALIDVDREQARAAGLELLRDKRPQGGATAYVCEEGRCERPTSDPAVLAGQLARVRPLAGDVSPPPRHTEAR